MIATTNRALGVRTTRYVLSLLVGLVALLGASVPCRAAAPHRSAFAVVIGNNRSLENRRPDLHYADDDAAKYFAIFRTVAPEGSFLLADFDDDSARLFPDLRTQAAAPTRRELLRVGAELASRVREAAAAGSETDVYFIFAGHGDVDEGEGFLELADSRFTSDDLEHWLRGIPFTRAHVILDSCNSFFMLTSRRPGGRYYATSEDAARSLAGRLPNVGVFLSTSAEGESFEWSEIQSGVFSHVVRSGLLGAADADGDGSVSYLELAAFVGTATADVPNPNMRPHVFARGPGGHDEQPILPAGPRTGARSFHFTDTEPLRLRLRSRDGLPLLDANEAAGVALTLAMPASWTDGAVVERAGKGRGEALETYAIPVSTAEVTLASLQPATSRGEARGPAEIFERLFQRPFGPRAVAQYRAEGTSGPPPVFGVSREDAARMNLLLDQIGSAERGRRLTGGALFLAGAAFYGGLGASAIAFDRSDPATSKTSADTFGAVLVGAGAASLVAGAYMLAVPWSGERLAADYRAALATGDYAHAFALADERIVALAAQERRERVVREIVGGALVVGSAAALVANELATESATQRFDLRALTGFCAVLGVTSLASAIFSATPVEHLTDVWQRDPGRIHLQPTLAPTVGGAAIGLSGRF